MPNKAHIPWACIQCGYQVGLLSPKTITEDGIVLKDKHCIEVIFICSLNDTEVAQEISIDALRTKTVCFVRHRRLRKDDFGVAYIEPGSREFAVERAKAVSSGRKMNDGNAVKVIEEHFNAYS
ncbi:hypothetical protein LMTR13_09835 [Bradyrhizobium icense]|uniref:Uncharacterized protein n=1 Tax=Bradyrhizobium icense TaxID=1274631 RepID=A0A1B1UCF3_9BRAD|nr:hypothetical protein LMTR13_09835 [Bradyrhizobium icense]